MTSGRDHVAPGTIAAYERDGVVCLRDRFDAATVELTRRGIERNLANPGPFFRDQTPDGSAGRYVFEYWSWPDIAEFGELIHNSPAGAIAGHLLRARSATLLMDNWFLAEAGAANGAPWHHDKPYFDFEGRMCSVWIALEDTTAAEGLTFVKGSHRWPGLIEPQDFRDHEPFDGLDDDYAPAPVIDAASDDLVSWDVAAGDCLVFDLRTLHAATPGRRPNDRTIRRMSLRFGAEDTVFSPRGSWTEETTRHLRSLGQAVDAPIDCPLLPTVWRAA